MKTLLLMIVSGLITQSAMAQHLTNYECRQGKDQFILTLKPANQLGYYVEAKGGKFAWTGSASVAKNITCTKGYTCYSGSIGATAIKPGASIPKELKHWSIAASEAILNGLMKGKVISNVGFSKDKTYNCKMNLTARRQ